MKKTELILYRKSSERLAIRTNQPNDFSSTPQESVEFFESLIQPGDLVFDVGANVGGKTKYYLSCGATVVCFEPLPPFIEELRQNFAGNPCVQIEEICLGSHESVQEMLICSGAPNISTLSKGFTLKSRFSERGYRWDQKILVAVTTLDRMIEKHGLPQFCKIDVENFEFDVLQGLHQPIRTLSFECNTDQMEATVNCLNYLVHLGYRSFNFAPAERGYFLFPAWLSKNDLLAGLRGVMEECDFSSIWGLWGDIYARV